MDRAYYPIRTRASLRLFYNKHNSLYFARRYIYNNLHLARKYARTSVRGHYLFRKANSFSRAKLEENCELWGTDKCPRTNIREYFQSQMQAIVFIILQIFFAAPGICHFVIYQSHQRLSIGFQNPYVFNSFSILRPLNMPRFSWRSMLLKSAIFKCKEMRLFQFRERQYIVYKVRIFLQSNFLSRTRSSLSDKCVDPPERDRWLTRHWVKPASKYIASL